MSNPSFTHPALNDSDALYDWYGEERYYDDGFEEVHSEESGGKHDLTECRVVLAHKASGRFLRLWFARSYNDGPQDYSFGGEEVFPHTVTTTVYKGKPA